MYQCDIACHTPGETRVNNDIDYNKPLPGGWICPFVFINPIYRVVQPTCGPELSGMLV